MVKEKEKNICSYRMVGGNDQVQRDGDHFTSWRAAEDDRRTRKIIQPMANSANEEGMSRSTMVLLQSSSQRIVF